MECNLLYEFVLNAASRAPQDTALACNNGQLSYEILARSIEAAAKGFLHLGLQRAERIGVYLEKRAETVVSMLAATYAGGAFVPLNPLLKAEQVGYILRDCNVTILVTSVERLSFLALALRNCPDLRCIAIVGDAQRAPSIPHVSIISWEEALSAGGEFQPHRVIDADMAAIFYTSGSTGKPKGVVLSHRNMTAGAKSVAQYLENHRSDRILSVLPLSFDAGFSQLTTVFYVGAQVTLLNYLLPRDVIDTLGKDRITGLTAVPPLWIQLAQQDWPEGVVCNLRYIANTGGHMPKATLDLLRSRLPRTLVNPENWYTGGRSYRSAIGMIRRRPRSVSGRRPANRRG